MTNVDYALVAVADGSGAVYEVVRRACPDLPMRKVDQPPQVTNGSGFALVLFAIYGPEDWRGLKACARSILTVAVSAVDDPAQASRAWNAGAFGLLHIGLSQEAMRRAIIGAMHGEAAYSRAALGEQIKAELILLSGSRP
jgi:hypothetical protein